MTRVIVRPAGPGRESVAVLGLCLGILVLAGGIIGLHRDPSIATATAQGQLDARSQLTPAEQGILADLRIAADDIVFLSEGGSAPTPADLADEGLPPFASGPETAARGGHDWSLDQRSDLLAYLGRSADAERAGDMLLLVDATGAEPATVWLGPNLDQRGRDLPANLPDDLVASGWHEIVISYDASVTRHTKDHP